MLIEPTIPIQWPDGQTTQARPGEPWLGVARRAQQLIPTACQSGSCGACEIEVNGTVVRACVSTIPAVRKLLRVSLASDPFW